VTPDQAANPNTPQPVTTQVPPPKRRVFRELTMSGRLVDFAWRWAYRLLFRPTPVSANAWRRCLLRLFLAHIHPSVVIHPTVRIIHPWNLTIDADVSVDHHVVLDCQAPVKIGAGTRISQLSHLCTATHIYDRRTMPIIGRPITIGKNCWLAADVFVGCGVTIGDEVVLGARSSVFKDVPSGTIMAGSPARKLRDTHPPDRKH